MIPARPFTFPSGRASLIPAAALAGALITASAYWPGLMSWDPVHQYGQAVSGRIDDWHPPAMQWLWRQMLAIHSGPAPMLVLQLALYWGGLALLATTIRTPGGNVRAWAVLACGMLPLGLALTGMIFKDSLMAGTLLVATALLARRQQGGGVVTVMGGLVLLVAAATLRFNAFTAGMPLLVALLPQAWRRTWTRMAVTAILATLALVAAMPVANRLIGASHSGVELSLVIFDLGGITEQSGVNVFPDDLEVPNAVAVNHGCYKPARWDSYSDWVDPECPLGFTAWNDNVDPAEVRPVPFWLRAIAAHPIAYAEHRLNHFAINTRILPLADAVERPVPVASAPNPWGFHIEPNWLTRLVDGWAIVVAHTPLGWPIVWIAVAAGALTAGAGLPSARLTVPLAASSLFYGGGYLVFSVASELRYHLWTELAALIALLLAVADPAVRSRRRFAWCWTPALLAVVAGCGTRLMMG